MKTFLAIDLIVCIKSNFLNNIEELILTKFLIIASRNKRLLHEEYIWHVSEYRGAHTGAGSSLGWGPNWSSMRVRISGCSWRYDSASKMREDNICDWRLELRRTMRKLVSFIHISYRVDGSGGMHPHSYFDFYKHYSDIIICFNHLMYMSYVYTRRKQGLLRWTSGTENRSFSSTDCWHLSTWYWGESEANLPQRIWVKRGHDGDVRTK